MTLTDMQTPFYRIKEADLLYDIDLLQTALSENWGSNTIMSYSVKTNALPWLLHYLKGKGFYAEVVSEMEYDLVRRLGFPGKHMIYNGPIKDKKTLFFRFKRWLEKPFIRTYYRRHPEEENVWKIV